MCCFSLAPLPQLTTISDQELKQEIANRDAIIAADKAQLTELLAKIADLTTLMEKLQTEKTAQDEEIKAMQVGFFVIFVKTIAIIIREAFHPRAG